MLEANRDAGNDADSFEAGIQPVEEERSRLKLKANERLQGASDDWMLACLSSVQVTLVFQKPD